MAAGRAGPARRPRSRPVSRSGSRSRRVSPAGHPTPPRPSTAALEAWGAELDDDGPAAAAARLGSDVPFFLAGGPALVEGRGERVAPLHGLHGAPGVLLVTPAVAVPTADVFAAFDAIRGARRRRGPDVVGAPRRGAALRADRRTALVARAGVLASANDLLPATPLVVPGLVAVRARAQPAARAAGRAVGLRADALGALSFGRRGRDGRRDRPRRPCATGPIAAPGAAEPFVAATTIVAAQPARGGEP